MWLTNRHPWVVDSEVAWAHDADIELLSCTQVSAFAFVRSVTSVPVARRPSEVRYGATVVSSRATPALFVTQLSAAVISVREKRRVTYGPGAASAAWLDPGAALLAGA